MSEDYPPRQEEKEDEPPEPALGPMGLGILLGATALYVFYLFALSSMHFLAGPAALIPIGVYLLVAVVLAVRPRTSRLGAGLLIGMGIFTLLGGGICVGLLAQMRPLR